MPSPRHGMEKSKSLRHKEQQFLAQGRSQDWEGQVVVEKTEAEPTGAPESRAGASCH